jgi:DNA-binding beta-propeller fold protein YncE
LIGIKLVPNINTPSFEVIFKGDPQDGWLHSGVGVLSNNRIVFEASGGSAFLIYDSISKNIVRVPVDIAVVHGITISVEQGHDFIWICDPGASSPGRVIKVNLQGEIVKEIFPPQSSPRSEKEWRPTSIAIAPDGDIWVADGYGLSLLHLYKTNGEIFTIDGSESGTVFNCPHGVVIDNRDGEPKIAVADRNNKRVVVLNCEGKFLREIRGEIMTSPSSITGNEESLFITDLHGAILSISRKDEVVALIPTAHHEDRQGWPNTLVNGELFAPEIGDGEINSPHGIAVTPEGLLFISEWYLGGRVLLMDLKNN